MIRQVRFSLPLGSQFALASTLAVFIPILLLGFASYNSANQVAIENLQAIVAESGARQREAIENDFRTALTAISDFGLNRANQALLAAPIAERNQIGISTQIVELEQEARSAMRRGLLSTGWVNSVWLVAHNDPQPFAIETVASATVPVSTFTVDANTRIVDVAQALVESNALQTLLVVEINEQSNIFHIAPLFTFVDDEPVHIGTLVSDLNLEALIVSNLNVSERLETVSFVLLPNDTVITAAATAPLVDLTTLGVSRVRATSATNVINYRVQRPDNEVDVIGYYTTMRLLGLPLRLVSEVEAAVAPGQVNRFATSIGFVVLLGGFTLSAIVSVLLYQLIVPPLLSIRDGMRAVGRGNLEAPIKGTERSDEVGSLAKSFVEMRDQIRRTRQEDNERAQALARDVRVTQDISRTIVTERDLKRLLDTVVQQIIANFPTIYHAQIFLLSHDSKQAVLQASTGETGANLLQRGHRLPVGSISVIGQVTEQNQIVIARDIAQSNVHRRNEFLAETRAEAALPLAIDGRVIGALDVQSRERDSFDDNQVQALRTLADQISIAIENARLYEETARLLADIQRDRAQTTQEAWGEFVQQQDEDVRITQSGYETEHNFDELRKAVMQSGHHVIDEVTRHGTVPFAVPINLRGVTLGVVTYELRREDFDYDKVLLAQEMVNRLAISLDNARLFRDSQQATRRERLVNDISAKLTQHNNVHDIIETAVREVSEALRTPQVAVRFQLSDPAKKVTSNGHHPSTKPEEQ